MAIFVANHHSGSYSESDSKSDSEAGVVGHSQWDSIGLDADGSLSLMPGSLPGLGETREDLGSEQEEAAYDAETDLDDDSLMLQVERARWAQYAGSEPVLRAGALLVASPGDGGLGAAFVEAVVLLTAHGGTAEPSVGYVVNSQLPAAEADAARRALHLDDFAQQARVAAGAVRTDKVWLGAGGPVKSAASEWVHVHDCPAKADSVALAAGVAVDGDVVEVLGDAACFVKLLYGEAVWAPGQLDREVSEGTWLLREATPDVVFHPGAMRRHAWELARAARPLPAL